MMSTRPRGMRRFARRWRRRRGYEHWRQKAERLRRRGNMRALRVIVLVMFALWLLFIVIRPR